MSRRERCRRPGEPADEAVTEASTTTAGLAPGARDRLELGRPLVGRLALRRPGADRGSASLWVLAVGLVLVAAAVAGAAIGAARVARHQAWAAADFGALAGAARVLAGPDAACARASEIARANGGRLMSCAVDGLDLQITVEVAVTPLPSLTRVARATARAGPVRG